MFRGYARRSRPRGPSQRTPAQSEGDHRRAAPPRPDALEGLSPAVAIEQKNPTTSSRSTVGTATEIYDYLRLLWARAGTPHCRKCGAVVKADTVQGDRKSTRLNSSHVEISYAVFCLK